MPNGNHRTEPAHPFSRIIAALRHEGAAARRHRLGTIVIHWLTGGLFVYAVIFNGETMGAMNDRSEMLFEVALGSVVGVAFLFRWFWMRARSGGSSLPQDSPRWEHLAANIVHVGIYLSLATVIATGIGIAMTRPPYSETIDIEFASFTGSRAIEWFVASHNIASEAMLLLLLLHVAGAFWHWVVRRDGVWHSIFPRVRR